MNATSPPSTTPNGIRVIMVNPPAHTPTPTEAATISTKTPIMYGSSRLSSLRCRLNACQSWRRRSLDAALRAACASARAALLSAALRGFAIVIKNTYAPRSASCRGTRGAGACGLVVEPAGAVGRPHQRPGQHTREAESLGVLRELDELLRPDPAVHRVMARRGAQVLGDGDDVAARGVQIGQGGAHLVGGFTEAEDEVALGDQSEVAGRGQHPQAALVGERGANPLEDPRNGLDVVRQHFWARFEHLRKPGRLAGEVGDQQFDAGRRVEIFDSAHGLGVQPGAAVGQVVAGYAGDGGIPQAHRSHALRDPPGLVAVQFSGFSGVDLAEVAAPAALRAADQEGGFAVFPALEDIRAAGLFADRVQALASDQAFELGVLRSRPDPCLDPRGLALDRGLCVAYFQPQQSSA